MKYKNILVCTIFGLLHAHLQILQMCNIEVVVSVHIYANIGYLIQTC